MRRLLTTTMSSWLLVGAQVALAGPYADLAAQVQSAGGLLQVWLTDPTQPQDPSTLTTLAVSYCHTIASEGVQTTQVQFLAVDGTTVLIVNAAQLVGC